MLMLPTSNSAIYVERSVAAVLAQVVDCFEDNIIIGVGVNIVVVSDLCT